LPFDLFLCKDFLWFSLFGSPNPPFSDSAIKSAKQGEPQEILAEKQVKRQTMLQALGEYTRESDPRIFGVLDGGQNRPLSKLPNDVPVFLMFGRLDPRQKGFDLLTQVIRELPRGTAKFVLTPIVASVPQPFLDDLKGVAEECLGDVVVYPFRMMSGYMETMAGASFAVMPSIYEPFGGATEPYLQGTPVVARASGGLVQQVADVETSPTSATGILFREAFEPGPNSWSELLEKESPKDRRETKLYCSMVDSLKAVILQAVDICREKPDIYGKMLTNVFNAALAFSWDRAAEEYETIYSQAIQ
jgi:glycosyltransferase involved in cell wall biosynthesis